MRDAVPRDIEPLAELWHSGWQDAHARILPADLARHRTLENFRERMRDHLADVRVAGPVGAPLGFTMFKDDELYQVYVSAAARGTGVAAELLKDAEQHLRSRGVRKAWLACAIGNDRAARFYAKHGWRKSGNHLLDLPMPDGSVYKLEVWRYEKTLMLTGSCACGAVRWEFDGTPEGATACNCTACRRFGALWIYDYEGEGVRVTGETTGYIRGNSLSFNFCPRCGCVAYWRGKELDAQGRRRMAVNVRLAEPETVAAIPIDHFDGLDTFEDLPRSGRCVRDYWA